jgi:hypothetical protein
VLKWVEISKKYGIILYVFRKGCEMVKNKRTTISLLAVFVPLVLAIVGYILLPQRVFVEISFDDAIQKSDKIFSLIIPLFISLIGALMYFNFGKIIKKEISADDLKTGIKYLVFSLVGTALIIYLLVRNLLFL